MNDYKDRALVNLVNASGFALQLGLERQIDQARAKNFRVTSREHPWRHPETGREGFVDLVVQSGAVTWVVECKRPRGGTWVFLVPNDGERTVLDLPCLWIAGNRRGAALAGQDNILHKPDSPESMFCVVRGSGESERPMLERLANQVVLATNCLADEEIALLRKSGREFYGFYVPVIVTTADLQICRFDPRQVNLVNGEIADGEFESVPVVRFRKTFSSSVKGSPNAKDIGSLSKERERSVLVISAPSFISVLRQVDVISSRWSDEWPWIQALKRLEATDGAAPTG